VRAFLSFKYWATSDLGIGLDYRPLTDELDPTLTYRLVTEDAAGWRPAVIFGTSVDDFTFRGEAVSSRSYFATISKAFPQQKFWQITPFHYWFNLAGLIRTLL